MPKDPGEVAFESQIEFNGQALDVHQLIPQLPCSPEKRAQCLEHLEEGRGDEMYSDFWLMGCDFPVALQEGEVTVQLACKGITRFTKRCRLTLTQYSADGDILNKGSFE